MAGDRNIEVERLVAAERATRAAGESAARWWREMAATAATARTDRAFDSLLRTFLATIKNALNADAVSVLVANPEGDELVARASDGLSEELTVGLGIRIGEGMSGQVLATKKPLVFDDISTINIVSPVLRTSGMHSVVAVPIAVGQRVLGVLYAGSRSIAHFSSLDGELLEMIATRLAETLERVDAFETERTARAKAERTADHLIRLQRITAKLLSATTPEEIATKVTDALATDAVGVDVAWSSVWLVSGTKLLLVSTPRGLPVADSFGEIALDSGDPLARTVRDRCATYSEDGEASESLPDDGRLLYTSWAAIPRVVNQECIGVVVVAYRQSHEFDQDERDFLTAIADQAALATERARLYAAQVNVAETNAFFAQSARAIAEGTDFADTLSRLANLALHVLGDICLIDVLDEDGSIQRMVAQHRDETMQHLVDHLRTEYPPDPEGFHPAIEVIRLGKTRWSNEMSDDFLRETTRDEAHFALVKALQFRCYISVPLMGESEAIGVLTLVSTSRTIGPTDVSLSERFAEHVAAVIDNARRYESTVQTSHTLQQSLLPRRLQRVPGLQVYTRYLPATRGLEVGGDFYDLITLPGGDVGFMIGDVAGHDRAAAALMGQLRSAARALAGQVDTPSELIAALQWSWDLLGFDRIATGLFGRLDPATGDLMMASAGHYPPLLVEVGSGEYLPIKPGKPLGVSGGGSVDWHGRLEDGQALLLFTDGAIDEREIGATESMKQLSEVAANSGTTNLSVVCERIVRTLAVDRIDDVALLAIRRYS
ncbi:MAG: GAF domain-containing protein [Acidimicrobiales bacterium]